MPRSFSKRDKHVHKMTRDGLVDLNAATGEETRISQRGQDFNLLQEKLPRQAKVLRQRAETTDKSTRSSQYKQALIKTFEHLSGQDALNGQTLDFRQNASLQPTPNETTERSLYDNKKTDSPVQNSTQFVEPHKRKRRKRKPAQKAEQSVRRSESAPRYRNTSRQNNHCDLEQRVDRTPGEQPHILNASAYSALDNTRDNTLRLKEQIGKASDVSVKERPETLQPSNRVNIKRNRAFAYLNPLNNNYGSKPSETDLTSNYGRLKFDRKQGPPVPESGTRQHGTKYQQRYMNAADDKEVQAIDNPPYFYEAGRDNQGVSEIDYNKQPFSVFAPKTESTLHMVKPDLPDTRNASWHLLYSNRRNLQFTNDEQHQTAESDHAFKIERTTVINSKRAELPSGNSALDNCRDLHHEGSTSEPALKTAAKHNVVPASAGSPVAVDKASDNKLTKLQQQTDLTAVKLGKARNKIPHKNEVHLKRSFDKEKGKVKHRLQFEEEALPPGPRRPSALSIAPKLVIDTAKREAIHRFHQKIYEVENENVGVKAAHRAERIAEGLYRGSKKVTRSLYNQARNRPYRTVEKLEKKAAHLSARYAYRSVMLDKPQLKSNALSRNIQKKKIRRQYAKVVREAGRTGLSIKNAGDLMIKATRLVTGFTKRHPAFIGMILIILLFVFITFSMLSSCSNMLTGALTAIFTSSYTAEDQDIDNSELVYTLWETELNTRIKSAAEDHAGYDEYRYQIGDISHDPFELMAFLTAVYQDFDYADIERVLRQIFDEQYQLSFVEETETRYRSVTLIDPDTGEEYEGEEAYEWRILNIVLHAQSFTDIIMQRMDTEQYEIFELLMETKGNRQYLESPFPFNWLPYVMSYYGYRLHPITGAVDYHMGIDISIPIGTGIRSGQDGRVIFAGYTGEYGYVVIIEDKNGLQSKYGHCDSISVGVGQEVKTGDIIAKSGNSGSSTGPHVHIEILKDGYNLNPLYFIITNDDGSGRIPPGKPGGLSFPDYPGDPMGDGSYAALIAEAEKYLGFPYVWGGSTPSTSFDCSGYVSWVLNQAGIANFVRTTAQGLFNLSTPISIENAQPGDLIFFTGTYSSSNPVTHVGIYVGGGVMLHCGNPIQYTSVETSYWQSYYYSCGRIN